MFCVRILPSLCGFPCGSNFCLKGLLFAFKFTCPLRDVSRLCDVSIIDLSKMTRGVIPSTIIILVTKPISITPVRHLFGKQVKKSSRSKQSLKAKANHSLKKLFRINHRSGAWVHWQCQSCSRYSLLMRGYREIGLRTAFKSYSGHYHYHLPRLLPIAKQNIDTEFISFPSSPVLYTVNIWLFYRRNEVHSLPFGSALVARPTPRLKVHSFCISFFALFTNPKLVQEANENSLWALSFWN